MRAHWLQTRVAFFHGNYANMHGRRRMGQHTEGMRRKHGMFGEQTNEEGGAMGWMWGTGESRKIF